MLRLRLLSRLGRFCKQVESVPPCSWGEEVRLEEGGGEREGEGWETCGRATGAAGLGLAAPTGPRRLGWARAGAQLRAGSASQGSGDRAARMETARGDRINDQCLHPGLILLSPP